MSASSRGWHTLSALSRRSPRICSRCARGRLVRATQPSWPRAYSSVAAAEASTVPPAADPPVLEQQRQQQQPPLQTVAYPKSAYRIKAGMILSRAPILTREPTPFEAAFFLYQKRLNERLATRFHPDLYFKTDTPPALDWSVKLKERRGTAAKEIGVYKPKGVWGWNDEVRVGNDLAPQDKVRECLVADAEMRFSDDGELLSPQDRVPVDKPMPRRTEADEKGDVRRLDRALDQTLYLVVKGRDGSWGFPAQDVPTDEALHQTAMRTLEEAAGVNMNTWMVGRAPIAHHVVSPEFAEDDPTNVRTKGSKTFFLKSRIMAGQADIAGNPLGITDFKWLTQDELRAELPADYFKSVRGMLAER